MPYVVVEGLDLAGKSTLTAILGNHLKARLVSEPFTESASGKRVKEVICGNFAPTVYEIMILAGQRVEAFRKVTDQYLSHGRSVVSDRNVLSSMVYQSSPEESPLQVLQLNKSVLEAYGMSLAPDHLFLIDIDYDTYMERCSSRAELDGKETKLQNEEFFNRQREKYFTCLELFKKTYPETQVHVVKPGISAEEVLSLLEREETEAA